jgi:hypothetical protein
MVYRDVKSGELTVGFRHSRRQRLSNTKEVKDLILQTGKQQHHIVSGPPTRMAKLASLSNSIVNRNHPGSTRSYVVQ